MRLLAAESAGPSAAKAAPELEEVIVRASLLHRNVDSNTTPLHVVDQDALAKMPVLSLGESLGFLGRGDHRRLRQRCWTTCDPGFKW